QAEDGIRDSSVTGVQTCALPISNLALKQGHEVLGPGSLARLTEVSRYVYEIANMNFRPGQPFVGTSAFAHKGGMHAHGVARNTEIGRASCREGVGRCVGGGAWEK